MPGPMTVVTFLDADGDEFPITLIGTYATMQDAIEDANGVFTKARLDGALRPTMPVRVNLDRLPYEWGNAS